MRRTSNPGFTLLEMLVSVGIFSVLIVSSIAVILSISSAQIKTANVQNIQDNMRYTMELMSREIRQAKNYVPYLCSGDMCRKIKVTKFEEAGEVSVWYCWVAGEHGGEIRRWKQTSDQCDTSPNAEVLTGSEVNIQALGFLVVGEESNTCVQPRVTIVMEGRSNHPKTILESEFQLQTTVTQRIRKIIDPSICES